MSLGRVHQGVAGPESANNAAASASFIPMMTLGILQPGYCHDLAALLIQGVITGPLLISEHSDLSGSSSFDVYREYYVDHPQPTWSGYGFSYRVPYLILAPIIVMSADWGLQHEI